VDYHLETLGDERFQKLCQAILTTTYPNVQCLPVGQPDGGRDGLIRRRSGNSAHDMSVFQVKFVKDPNSRDARDLVESVIQSERDKVIHGAVSISDRNEPLLLRAASARENRNNQGWWLAQIRAALALNDGTIKFVLLAFFQWAAYDVVLDLYQSISDAVDGLDKGDWVDLIRTIEGHQNRWSAREAQVRSPLPRTMSPRLACLLMAKLPHVGARKIRRKYLVDYRGEDYDVWHANVWSISEETTKHSKGPKRECIFQSFSKATNLGSHMAAFPCKPVNR
jgi:hypothetical protein